MTAHVESESSPYSYRPLLHDDSIRVLELEPSRDRDAELRCVIRHTRLSETPIYEALSYTWGEPEFPETLFAKIHSGFYTAIAQAFGITNNLEECFKITDNLCHALKSLRLPAKSRTLWVDALCINQNDLEEKGKQVAMMSNIYMQCLRVVGYLGQGDEKILPGIDALRSIASFASYYNDADAEGLVETFKSRTPLSARDSIIQSVKPQMKIILDSGLFKLAWFSRLWIVQEAILPAQIILWYGDDQFDWSVLAMAHDLMYRVTLVAGDISDISLHISSLVDERMMFRVRQYFAEGEPDLNLTYLWILDQRHTSRLCQNDRDRVYALLGLYPNTIGQLVNVDYQKSTSAVYTDLARIIIENYNLGIISQAGIWPRIANTAFAATISDACPSWVPDYRTTHLKIIPNFEWSLKLTQMITDAPRVASVAEWLDRDNRRMRLRGIELDIFDSSVAWEGIRGGTVESLFKHIFSCWESWSTKTGIKSAAKLERLFADVVVAGALSPAYPIPTFDRDLDQVLVDRFRTLTDIWHHHSGDLTQSGIMASHLYPNLPDVVGRTVNSESDTIIRAYIMTLSMVATRYHFFITQKGDIGLSPCKVGSEDIIVMIRGLPTPYILRKTSTERQYELVASCYMPEYMKGVFDFPDGELEIFDLV